MLPLVLSVDDDFSSQILMKAYLKDEDFCDNFVFKSNGAEALDYLLELNKNNNARLPNLMFLDINMPVMDGWGFLDEISKIPKRKHPLPPIVLVSATNTPQDMEKASKHPLVHCLAKKPIGIDLLDSLKRDRALAAFFESEEASSADLDIGKLTLA